MRQLGDILTPVPAHLLNDQGSIHQVPHLNTSPSIEYTSFSNSSILMHTRFPRQTLTLYGARSYSQSVNAPNARTEPN